MHKALPACGFAALVVAGLALFSGQSVRMLAPIEAGKVQVLDQWIPKQRQVDGLRSLAWEQRAWFIDYWLADAPLSEHQPTLERQRTRWSEALATWRETASSDREREALARLEEEQRELDRALGVLDRFRRETPETGLLFREDVVRTFRRIDAAIAQLQGTAESGIRREIWAGGKQRQALLGASGWLLLSLVGAGGLIWGAFRSPAPVVQVVAAEAPAEAEPKKVEEPPDPLAGLGALTAPAEVPAPAQAAVPHGYPPPELLNALCRKAEHLLIALDRKEQFAPPTVEWMSDNGDLLGVDAPTGPVVGRKVEEVFPRLREIFDAAFKGLTPGETRTSEVDLGTKEAPKVCSMVIFQPANASSQDGRILCQIAPLGEIVQLRRDLESARKELAPLQERINETIQAKNQVNEKRRDLIKLIDGQAFEFEVKPDGQSIVCTDLPQAVADIHGVKLEDLFNDGRLLTKFIIKADRPAFEAALEASIKEGKPLDASYGIMTSAGVERWLRLRALPRKTPEEWTRFSCVLTDRTEAHKQAEDFAKAQARADMLASLGDCLPEPVFAINQDAKNQIAYVNRLAAEHFGYSPEEISQVQIGNLDSGFDAALAGIDLAGNPRFLLAGSHETANGTIQVSVEYHTLAKGGRHLAGFIKERSSAEVPA